MRDYEERSKSLQTCGVLVYSVLVFDMELIKNLIMMDIRVLLCYNFGSEKLKEIPNKFNLVEAVNWLFYK